VQARGQRSETALIAALPTITRLSHSGGMFEICPDGDLVWEHRRDGGATLSTSRSPPLPWR
jgi:predicted Rdx family selenoprotein